MLKKIILILLLIPIAMLGQTKKLELGLMIGNNGQLDNMLNDLYIYQFITRTPPKHIITEKVNIKYSVSARYFFKDNFSVRINFGRYSNIDILTQTTPTNYQRFDINQSVTNISPAVCFSKKFDKLSIMTGLEIPLMHVGDFVAKINDRYMPDSVNANSDIFYKITTTGGFIWGVNNFIGLKYHFTNRISMGAEIKYGLLFAKLGNKYTVSNALSPGTPYQNYIQIEKKYNRTFFSPPEVSLGLFILLGRNKTKS